MGEIFARRYELLDPIADGGMGSVWRVRDHQDGDIKAAKLLRQRDASSLLRFMREQSTRIHHPHVVTPLSWVGEDDAVLFTMPLVHRGVESLRVAPWRARRIARMTHHLSQDAARFVDAQLAPVADSCGVVRIDRLVTEAVARFDAEAQQQVDDEAEAAWGVKLDHHTGLAWVGTSRLGDHRRHPDPDHFRGPARRQGACGARSRPAGGGAAVAGAPQDRGARDHRRGRGRGLDHQGLRSLLPQRRHQPA